MILNLNGKRLALTPIAAPLFALRWALWKLSDGAGNFSVRLNNAGYAVDDKIEDLFDRTK